MQKPIYYTAEQLNKVIEQTPRFKFLSGTTPLEELRNLSRFIDGPPIFVKRDDLTGPAFGGNKVRHFEFVMGYVLGFVLGLSGWFETMVAGGKWPFRRWR